MPVGGPSSVGWSARSRVSHNPPSNEAFSGQSHRLGQSWAAGNNAQPNVNPVTGAPIPRYNKTDQLKERFGIDVPQLPQNPADNWETQNRDFPDAINSPADINTQIIIAQIRDADMWPIRLMPFVRTDKLQIEWNEWIFNESYLVRTPEESVSRYASNFKRQHRSAMLRLGHAIKMERNHFLTKEGAFEYAMKLRQIAFALMEGACFDVLVALMESECDEDELWNKAWDDMQYLDNLPILSKFRNELDNWGVVNKGAANQDGLKTLHARMNNQFQKQNQGEYPNVFIHAQGVAEFWSQLKDAESFASTGKTVSGDGKAYSRHLEIAGSKAYYESRLFRLGNHIADDDPLIRRRSIGTYFRMNDEHVCDIPVKDFKISMLDTIIFNEDTDKLLKWGFMKNFKYLGCYDDWSTEQRVDAPGNHPVLSQAGLKHWGPVQSYKEAYEACGSGYFDRFVEAVSIKPDCIQDLTIMSQIPFKPSNERKHIANSAPLVSMAMDGHIVLSVGSGGGGKKKNDKVRQQYEKKHRKQAKVANGEYDIDNDETSRLGLYYNNDDDDQDDDDEEMPSSVVRKQKKSSSSFKSIRSSLGKFFNVGAGSGRGNDSDSDSGSSSSSSSDSDSGSDADDDQDMKGSSVVEKSNNDTGGGLSLDKKLAKIRKTIRDSHELSEEGLELFIHLLSILDTKTNNKHGYMKTANDLLWEHRDDKAWKVPGFLAWQSMSLELIQDELAACLHDILSNENIPLTELEEKAHKLQAVHFASSDRDITKELIAADAVSYHWIPEGKETIKLYSDPFFQVNCELPQQAELTTLTSTRVVLCEITPDTLQSLLENHGTMQLEFSDELKKNDPSYVQGSFRLAALQYSISLSAIARLVQLFDINVDIHSEDDISVIVNQVRTLCTPQPIKGSASDYIRHVKRIQKSLPVASFQLALEPLIRSLHAIVALGIEDGVSDTKIIKAMRESIRYLHDHHLGFKGKFGTSTQPMTGASGIPAPHWTQFKGVTDADREELASLHLGIFDEDPTDNDIHERVSHTLGSRIGTNATFKDKYDDLYKVLDPKSKYTRDQAWNIIVRLCNLVYAVSDHIFEGESPVAVVLAIVNTFMVNPDNIDLIDEADKWFQELKAGKLGKQLSPNLLIRGVKAELKKKTKKNDASSKELRDMLSQVEVRVPTRQRRQPLLPGSIASTNETIYQALTLNDIDKQYVKVLLENTGNAGVRLSLIEGHATHNLLGIAVCLSLAAKKLQHNEVNEHIELNEFLTTLNPSNPGPFQFTGKDSTARATDIMAILDNADYRRVVNVLKPKLIGLRNYTKNIFEEEDKHSSPVFNSAGFNGGGGNGGNGLSSGDKLALKSKLIDYFAHLPIHDGRAMYIIMKHDVCPPYGYVNYRSSMTYDTGACIAVHDEADKHVGTNWYMPANMALGEDVLNQTIHGSFIIYQKAVVQYRRGVIRAWDVFIKKYCGGNGPKPIEWYSTPIARAYAAGTPVGDIICTPRLISFTCNCQPLDLTGKYQRDVGASDDDNELCEYPLSDYICTKLGIKQSTISPFKHTFKNAIQRTQVNEVNTICFQGHQQIYDHLSGGLTQVIMENGHWGPEVGEGCGKNRCGYAVAPMVFNYAKENTIRVRR